MSEHNFLSDYDIYTEGNESPRIFHIWSALSTLSNFIGRRVWTEWGIIGNIYPQLYVILAGDPGCKKSTAMRISRRFVQGRGDVVIAPASITKEAITQMMGSEKSPCLTTFEYLKERHEFSHLAVYADEFVNLINSGGNPIGMIDFFTEVWGSDLFLENTKNKGNQTIKAPYISMLACMTSDTVRSLMAQKIISGGMTRRCIFAYGKSEGKSIPFPTETGEQKAACLRLASHGQYLKNLAGPCYWTPEGRAFFEQWYHTNTKRRERESNSVLAQFLETKPEYVIKIAMLLALAEYDVKELCLEASHVERATELVTLVENGSSDILSGTGRNPMALVQSDVMKTLSLSSIALNAKQLYTPNRGHATWQEFQDVMAGLVATREVCEYVLNITPPGRPPIQVKYYTHADHDKTQHDALKAEIGKRQGGTP